MKPRCCAVAWPNIVALAAMADNVTAMPGALPMAGGITWTRLWGNLWRVVARTGARRRAVAVASVAAVRAMAAVRAVAVGSEARMLAVTVRVAGARVEAGALELRPKRSVHLLILQVYVLWQWRVQCLVRRRSIGWRIRLHQRLALMLGMVVPALRGAVVRRVVCQVMLLRMLRRMLSTVLQAMLRGMQRGMLRRNLRMMALGNLIIPVRRMMVAMMVSLCRRLAPRCSCFRAGLEFGRLLLPPLLSPHCLL